MSPKFIAHPPPGGGDDSSALVRRLLRMGWKGALATLDRDTGQPYVSLVSIATDAAGRPLLLLSDLAEHSRNLAADDRASLLVDATGDGPDALTGPRTTVTGQVRRDASPHARLRYLARHPGAAMFVDFADFKLLHLEPARAHLVAGFGRIARLEASSLLSPTDDAATLLEAEPDIVAHMNTEHADACALLAGRPAGANGEVWAMTGCDPCGIDLVCGAQTSRVEFPHRVTNPASARKALVALVTAARNNAEIRPSSNVESDIVAGPPR